MRRLVLPFLCLLLLLPAQAGAASREQKDALWDFADQRSQELDRYWSEEKGYYNTGSNQMHITMSMLYLHASAAIADRQGASRQDDRVEAITRRLISWPSYIEDRSESGGGQVHAPGFTLGITSPGEQHVSFDTQAVNGLTAAVQSGLLSKSLAREVARKVTRVAKGKIFTAPSLQLNQVNWPLQMWWGQAQITGSDLKARKQFGSYMNIWARGMSAPMPGNKVPNLSAGLGLRYSPKAKARGSNLASTTEYANIIYSGFQGYDRLVGRGMKPLSSFDEMMMKAWARRLLYGDWTHSGWPNWDTYHGFSRWHLWRYWPWCAEALVTMSSSRRLAGAEERGQAAWMLERVLERYRWLLNSKLLSGSTRYGLQTDFGQPADDLVTGARLAAIAARAARSPIAQPQQPAGWFWFDKEMQRLAVSSPTYSAAVMAPIATPAYGGLELSRLLDSQGRVLTSLGADAAQSGFTPKGGLSTQAGFPAERSNFTGWAIYGPYSGSLGQVELVGRTVGAAPVEVTQHFEAESITTTYRLRRELSGRLLIPLWGAARKAELDRSENRVILDFENSEGGKLRLIVQSEGKLEAKIGEITPSPASPQSKTQLQVEMSGSDQLQVAIYPQS